MDFIHQFSGAWSDPQMRHALVVHWPVVLSVLCMLLTLALALWGARNTTLKVITILACVALTVAGYIGLQSGERAENATGELSPAAEAVLEEHEELGEKVPLFAAVCAGLALLTIIPHKMVRVGSAAASFLACAGTAAWIANTAHHGGLLVYEHGVGTPPEVDAATAPATAPSSTSTTPPIDPNDPRLAFFREQVHPILADHCTPCHNPARVARGKSGKLDQTTLDGLLKGGRSGPAIVPGKPADSLLIQRVRGLDPEEDRMPPPPDPALTPEQIALLEQWIADGAIWP